MIIITGLSGLHFLTCSCYCDAHITPSECFLAALCLMECIFPHQFQWRHWESVTSKSCYGSSYWGYFAIEDSMNKRKLPIQRQMWRFIYLSYLLVYKLRDGREKVYFLNFFVAFFKIYFEFLYFLSHKAMAILWLCTFNRWTKSVQLLI